MQSWYTLPFLYIDVSNMWQGAEDTGWLQTADLQVTSHVLKPFDQTVLPLVK